MSDLEDRKECDSGESDGEEEEGSESYVHINGEWEDRKISLFGVVKSFISQLKFGEDLTRVSMPVVFCRPYSLLEEIGARNFVHFDILHKLKTSKEPAERLLSVIEWMISTARQEKFHHKPLNPVIGEINHCKYVSKKNSKDITYLITEQVKHHPPTSAVRVDNPKRGISIDAYYTFAIEFMRNSVAVNSSGRMTIKIGDETYLLKKPMPNLMIKNVILGSKLVTWEGDLTIECEQTGYSGSFELGTKGRTNIAKGGVYFNKESKDIPLIIVEGKCGGPATYNYNSKHPRFEAEVSKLGKKEAKAKRKQIEEKKSLVGDPTKRNQIVPQYPPASKQPENSSYNLWAPVRKCIIENDMDNGDIEKQKIEKTQREMFKKLHDEEKTYEPNYFKLVDEHWEIKNEKWYKKMNMF